MFQLHIRNSIYQFSISDETNNKKLSWLKIVFSNAEKCAKIHDKDALTYDCQIFSFNLKEKKTLKLYKLLIIQK